MSNVSSYLTNRKFGLIFLSYFAFIIFILMLRHHVISDIVWLIFVFCFLITCIAPKCLTPIQFLWDRALQVLRYVNTRLLLGFLFFCIFTPIGLCKKLLRKDTLGLRYDASLETYRASTINIENDLRRPY